jgi:hypothetical protein
MNVDMKILVVANYEAGREMLREALAQHRNVQFSTTREVKRRSTGSLPTSC